VVAPAEYIQHRAGCARLEVQVVCGESAIVASYATNPLKLLAPRTRGRSVWAYSSSFGGGLVAGDQTRLELSLGEHARCFLGTQASTKVYRNPGLRPCGHHTCAKLRPGSLLVFAPDPVQPFAGSSYQQRQEFHLATNASLILLDWFSSGRTARGERWAFNRFQNRNAVYQEAGELVFLESLLLGVDNEPVAAQHRGGRFNCFATLLLLGPAVSALATTVLAESKQEPIRRQAPLLASASSVRDGVVLRLAGQVVEVVGRELYRHLAPLSTLLGDDPWARKW
jgi:urease accessory protein